MPKVEKDKGSEYNQQSFVGGMNLLLDDTHLESNQYRIAFNIRNRNDSLDPILAGKEDIQVPKGLKQEMVTFGNYEILFVAGSAYYKLYNYSYWTKINTFSMSKSAPRYWTKAIPVATTNYIRQAGTFTNANGKKLAGANLPISLNNISGAGRGNLPGLLVQDNINQPVFIFINAQGFPTSRVTQSFSQWHITFIDADNVSIAADGDQREYVPIGNTMEWIDGILYIASQDGNSIYCSVSGRPLDFVRNVTNLLADGTTVPPFTQVGGGDASTTSYSVGVGGITCLRAMSDGSLFVAAGNANFSVTKNMSQNVTLQWGEYPFIRKFLFNAVCLSDRAIMDTLGDTRFITLNGVRSFNAVAQTQNEGRNLPFAKNISAAFGDDKNPIIQDVQFASCILFNDFELYALQTIFGPAVAVYDTLLNCWSAFDTDQTGGKRIKQLVKIELSVLVLFAITEDNKVYRLYVGPELSKAKFRTIGVCSNILYADQNVKMANPRMEIQPRSVRAILTNVQEDCSISMTQYVNNRRTPEGQMTHPVFYTEPTNPSSDNVDLQDVDTMLENVLFSTPNAKQGWKTFCVFEWTSGSLTQFSMELNDITPMSPLNSQPYERFDPVLSSLQARLVNDTPIPPALQTNVLTDEFGNPITDEKGNPLTPY